jgi:hypothetical protein
VLPQNPLEIDPWELLDLKASAVYVGGKKVSP